MLQWPIGCSTGEGIVYREVYAFRRSLHVNKPLEHLEREPGMVSCTANKKLLSLYSRVSKVGGFISSAYNCSILSQRLAASFSHHAFGPDKYLSFLCYVAISFDKLKM
ncbi:Hypothetical predicted protein [Podarcis lilfordi]|uniref:Uncharacterized protein n=1 Tax=Podarcis lilfordi TaxID=74358 RepID=A0AA35KV72_9SAUR|nr:Hypothetical predicted protein [Podarcis lilfordi]